MMGGGGGMTMNNTLSKFPRMDGGGGGFINDYSGDSLRPNLTMINFNKMKPDKPIDFQNIKMMQK